jgi:hypothetical protein
MKGLQRYSHEDRQRVVKQLIPQIREKFGDNLVAARKKLRARRGARFRIRVIL